jgi:hypothetical protein
MLLLLQQQGTAAALEHIMLLQQLCHLRCCNAACHFVMAEQDGYYSKHACNQTKVVYLAKWLCVVQQLTHCSRHLFLHFRVLPRVNCNSGASYDTIISSFATGLVQSWASRSCYRYTGTPYSCQGAADCSNQLPSGDLVPAVHTSRLLVS